MSFKRTVSAGIVALLTAGAAQAATIDPTDFDQIFTEGKRVQTVDGADVADNFAVNDNRDVENFDMGTLGQNTLLVGRVAGAWGVDAYFADDVTGSYTFTVLNYGLSTRKPAVPFEAVFELLVNGQVVSSQTLRSTDPTTVFENIQFGAFNANGDKLGVRVASEEGASDFDIAISAVPLPAGGLLLLSGFAGLAFMRRRKKA